MEMTPDDLDPIARPQDPTDLQREALFAIAEHWSRNGLPPSFRELRELLKISSLNAVSDLIAQLVKKHLVLQNGSKARTLIPTVWGWAAMGIRAKKLEPARTPSVKVDCRLCSRKVKHVALAKSYDFRLKNYIVFWKALAHSPCNPVALAGVDAEREQ